MSNNVVILPPNGYLQLSGFPCTFNTYFGTTASNQYDWLTNVSYDGTQFIRDDSSRTAWRIAHVVDGYDAVVINHWDVNGALTTPFYVSGEGNVDIEAVVTDSFSTSGLRISCNGLDPYVEQVSASNIPGPRVNGISVAIAIPNASTAYEGIGIYAAVTNASTKTNAVAGMFSARASGPGKSNTERNNLWAINSILEDGSPKDDTHYPWVRLAHEWDFNVFDPTTEVVAHSIGGAGKVQPQLALGYLVNTLGVGLKWDFGFSTMEGAATVAFSAGGSGGNNASSQPIRLYGRDVMGVAHSVDVTATPAGSLHVSTSITLPPILPPDIPASGFVLYTDAVDGRLKSKSASGSVTVLA